MFLFSKDVGDVASNESVRLFDGGHWLTVKLSKSCKITWNCFFGSQFWWSLFNIAYYLFFYSEKSYWSRPPDHLNPAAVLKQTFFYFLLATSAKLWFCVLDFKFLSTYFCRHFLLPAFASRDTTFTKGLTQMAHDMPQQLLVQLQRHEPLPDFPQTLPIVLNGVPTKLLLQPRI